MLAQSGAIHVTNTLAARSATQYSPAMLLEAVHGVTCSSMSCAGAPVLPAASAAPACA